jgi:hypothetical protein
MSAAFADPRSLRRSERGLRYGPHMDPTPVVVALVAVLLIGALVAIRLRASARRSRIGHGAAASPDLEQRLSTADQRFRMLSFQGGAIPGDLRPVLEELRRNGIEVDEATLRRKLADGASTMAEVDSTAPLADPPQGGSHRRAPATAIVLNATDVPGGLGLGHDRVRVQVTLELRVPDREPMREQRIAVIPADKRALLSDGAAVPVRYDPDDPRSLTLEWEITDRATGGA